MLGQGGGEPGDNWSGNTHTAIKGLFFISKISRRSSHLACTCYMCSRRAVSWWSMQRSVSLSKPIIAAPEYFCRECAANCLAGGRFWASWLHGCWELLLSQQGSSSWLWLWSAVTLPAPHQGSTRSSSQLLVTSAGRQHPGVCSCCCWAPWWEPVPRTQPSGVTHHLPGSNLPRISCSDLTGAESCMAWQRFPEWFQGFGREEALGVEMVVGRSCYFSQAAALIPLNPHPSAPRAGGIAKGSSYTDLSQRTLAGKVALD